MYILKNKRKIILIEEVEMFLIIKHLKGMIESITQYTIFKYFLY